MYKFTMHVMYLYSRSGEVWNLKLDADWWFALVKVSNHARQTKMRLKNIKN